MNFLSWFNCTGLGFSSTSIQHFSCSFYSSICNEKSPEIREDHERIVYGPKAQEERHGPSIINPSYDESSFASHIYAEVGDPIRIYANVKDDTSIQGQNLGLRFENPAYENTGFSNRVSEA